MNNTAIPLKERIIVALDVNTSEEAKNLVKKCESHVSFYKVGLQLFMASWFETVDWLVDRGHKVMLDLKFFDIPETVKLAVEQAITMNVVAATCNISKDQLEKLRGTCVSQVKRSNGAYSFEDALDFQKR